MIEPPSGWEAVPLEQICDVNPQEPGPKDRLTPVSFIPMPAVSDADGVILKHGIKPFGEVAKGYTRFSDGDVIFAKITPCMENGKIALASGLYGGFACGSTEFHVLRSRGSVLPRYLWYFLRQKQFRVDAERHMTGAVGQRRVPAQYLKNSRIPLPSIAEQRDIVAKLDGLLNASRRARQEISRISRLVERYKQAILKAAFRGDITAGWRKSNPLPRPKPPVAEGAVRQSPRREGGRDGRELSERITPETWKMVTIDAVGDVILGRQRSPENHNGPKMRSYVRAANITWGGWNFTDVKKMNFDTQDFERFKLHAGDVLINEGSGSATEVGKPAIWKGEIKDCCFQNTLIAVRPHGVTSEYLYFVILHAARSGGFVDEARGVNIHHIGRAGLAQFVVPVPPMEEQEEIVRRLKAAFFRIETLSEQVAQADELVTRLDEATLAAAFQGKLVASVQS